MSFTHLLSHSTCTSVEAVRVVRMLHQLCGLVPQFSVLGGRFLVRPYGTKGFLLAHWYTRSVEAVITPSGYACRTTAEVDNWLRSVFSGQSNNLFQELVYEPCKNMCIDVETALQFMRESNFRNLFPTASVNWKEHLDQLTLFRLRLRIAIGKATCDEILKTVTSVVSLDKMEKKELHLLWKRVAVVFGDDPCTRDQVQRLYQMTRTRHSPSFQRGCNLLFDLVHTQTRLLSC